MEQKIGYARLLRRIQSLLIDGIIIPVIFFGVIFIASLFELQGVYTASLAGLAIFIFEPFLVSTTGGTVGQHIVGIQVKNKKTGKNINIISAIIRFVVKIILGVISLITILTTRYHQGIHDALVGSIVTLKNPESQPSNELLKEREFELPSYIYPSKTRKIIMLIVYNVLIFIAITVAFGLLLSDECLTSGRCTGKDNIIALVLQSLWLICIPFSIIMCWKGRMFGCRRKSI